MKAVLLLFFTFVFLSDSHGAQKIGFVDVKKVFETFSETIESKEKLEKEYEKYKAMLEKLEKEIEELESEIDSPALSENKKQELIRELNHKYKNYEEMRKSASEVLEKMEKELTEKILKKIYEIIEKVATEKKYDLVLDKTVVLYGVSADDLTSLVIKRLERKNAKVKD